MRKHFMSILGERRSFEAKFKSASVELKATQEDLGKTVAQCAEAVNRAERAEAHIARLEALIVLKETELKRQAEEQEDLKASKLVSLDHIEGLEGRVEALTVEAVQAEVLTRTFALEQVVRGS